MNSTTIDPQATSLARPTADPPILPSVKLATIPDVADVGDTAEEAAVVALIPVPVDLPLWSGVAGDYKGKLTKGHELPDRPVEGPLRCMRFAANRWRGLDVNRETVIRYHPCGACDGCQAWERYKRGVRLRFLLPVEFTAPVTVITFTDLDGVDAAAAIRAKVSRAITDTEFDNDECKASVKIISEDQTSLIVVLPNFIPGSAGEELEARIAKLGGTFNIRLMTADDVFRLIPHTVTVEGENTGRRLTTFGDWPNFGDDDEPIWEFSDGEFEPTPASDWPAKLPDGTQPYPKPTPPTLARLTRSKLPRVVQSWLNAGNWSEQGNVGGMVSDLVNIAQLMQQENLTEFEYNELRSRRGMLTLLAEMEGYDGPRALIRHTVDYVIGLKKWRVSYAPILQAAGIEHPDVMCFFCGKGPAVHELYGQCDVCQPPPPPPEPPPVIEIPFFANRKHVYPLGNGGLEVLLSGLTGGLLKARTEGGHKGRLTLVCLGGPYRGLPPDAYHGHCNGDGLCMAYGYRNEQHIDWSKRTGIVLLDLDDVADADLDEVRRRFEDFEPTTALWLSASGHGFKVGVSTTPAPATVPECRDAWGAAALAAKELLTGIKYKIDPTHSAVQPAFLAHDPKAIAREPLTRLSWADGDFQRARPKDAAYAIPAWTPIKGQGVGELVKALTWETGSRSSTLFRLGVEAGSRGLDLADCLPDAMRAAEQTGLVADYGRQCIRHFVRGHERGADTLCTMFGVLAAPAQQGG